MAYIACIWAEEGVQFPFWDGSGEDFYIFVFVFLILYVWFLLNFNLDYSPFKENSVQKIWAPNRVLLDGKQVAWLT